MIIEEEVGRDIGLEEIDREVIKRWGRDIGLEPNEVKSITVTPSRLTVIAYVLDDEGRKQWVPEGVMLREIIFRVAN